MKLKVLINPHAGSVPDDPDADLMALAEEVGAKCEIVKVEPENLREQVEAAVKDGFDILAVWGGDGTIACALETVGPKGPPILPLPGGTMNLLHRRVHGVPEGTAIDWRECLRGAVDAGKIEPIGAGCVNRERRFYVGAMFGELVGLSRAREAIRDGRPITAVEQAAEVGAFDLTTSLAFHELRGEDIGMEGVATALAAFVPEPGDARLDVGWIDPDNLAELAGVGMEIALGDWRLARGVEYHQWEALRIFHAKEDEIETTLDGEPLKLRSGSLIDFMPVAAHVLAAPGS